MAEARHIVLAAGGTGGHMFPARALAEELLTRGYALSLVTDSRGGALGGAADQVDIHRINAASPAGRVGDKVASLARLGIGLLQARALLGRLQPAAVAGFGGYACVPTMWAATMRRLPTIIHEQNAVMGRANRLLAGRVDRIATSFADVARIRPRDAHKVMRTGNPVRADIAALGALPYPALDPAPGNGARTLHLLVLGGSQGARILSEVVPAAIASLPAAAQRRLGVVQQCRPEDLDAVRAAYRAANVEAELATFFDDMARRLGHCHLVICRAGASTVAEAAAAGRPAVLVPYPFATDGHQLANARAADQAGGAWLIPQEAFTEAAVAARLESFIDLPATLADAAARQLGFARADAAVRLADAVEALSGSNGNSGNRRYEVAA